MKDWPELLAQDLPTVQESVPVPPVPASYAPQVLIENIPPIPGIFTQSTATIVAALIALVAASLALGGVFYAQSVTRAATKAQLRQQRSAMIRQDRHFQAQLITQQRLHEDAQSHQAKQHEESMRQQRESLQFELRAAERKQHRLDKLDALMEAARVASLAADRGNLYIMTQSKADEDLDGNDLIDSLDSFSEAMNLCRMSEIRLTLLGLDDISEKLASTIVQFSEIYDPNNNLVDNEQVAIGTRIVRTVRGFHFSVKQEAQQLSL
ncbi:hypothetical protein R4P64_07795 [Rhodococcus sp. IEGM 1366]|uniref:hypothetical protein n=1 Tax=Rhodococcus sp. IEGM 1366 TaxID=3082223 RepID=UPI002954DC39|nr:hypothetical protein [Rhodococcus sp. IEGM 1366]MDV8066403.1 hypothetical protein [Rhodococcus sp. IEGM 1366]